MRLSHALQSRYIFVSKGGINPTVDAIFMERYILYAYAYYGIWDF